MKITAIAGRNGSGKTLYIDQLRKQLASDKVRYIAFTDSYGVNVDEELICWLVKTRRSVEHSVTSYTSCSTLMSFWINTSSHCRVASCANSN